MWELLYSSGLRLSELASLLYADYRGDWVRVLGKGNKMRDVPVGRKAKAAITQWLVIRAQWAQPTSVTLFISRQGKALTGRAIEYRLQKWGKKATPVWPFIHICYAIPWRHIFYSRAKIFVPYKKCSDIAVLPARKFTRAWIFSIFWQCMSNAILVAKKKAAITRPRMKMNNQALMGIFFGCAFSDLGMTTSSTPSL